jgi:hypothetical protein
MGIYNHDLTQYHEKDLFCLVSSDCKLLAGCYCFNVQCSYLIDTD